MVRARNDKPVQPSVLERYCAGILALIFSELSGCKMPICSACQRLPASTVIRISAGVLAPSAFRRAISGASLSVINLMFTPVFAVYLSKTGLINSSMREE